MAATQVFQVPVRLTPITVSQTSGVDLVPALDGAHPGVGHHDVEAGRAGRLRRRPQRSAHRRLGRRPAAVTTRPRPLRPDGAVSSRSARAWPAGRGSPSGRAQTSSAMMSAPSPARRTAWLRPWPRAGSGDQRDLAGHPSRPYGGAPVGSRPTGQRRRASGRPPRRSRGPAGDPRARPRARSVGATQSPARSSARPVPGRADSSGRRWPQSTSSAHATCRCSPVQTSSRRAWPWRTERSEARSSRRTPGRWSRVLASARSPGAREQGAGDLVGCHEGHLGARSGQPLGHTDPDRTADRVVDDAPDPPGRSRCRTRAGRARRAPGTTRPPRTPAGAGREPVASTTAVPRATGGVEVGRDVASTPVSIVTPEPLALVEQPLDECGRPFASGAGGPRSPTVPPGRAAPLDHPDPEASLRREPERTRDRRPRPRPQGRPPMRPLRSPPSASVVSWPLRGSPTQLTIGLRLSRTWQAWLQRMQGRTRFDVPSRTSATSRGSAIWARVISTRSATPSSRAALRPRPGRPRSPGGRPAPVRRLPPRIVRQSSRLKSDRRCGRRAGRRTSRTVRHAPPPSGRPIGASVRHLRGRVLGGDARPTVRARRSTAGAPRRVGRRARRVPPRAPRRSGASDPCRSASTRWLVRPEWNCRRSEKGPTSISTPSRPDVDRQPRRCGEPVDQ